MSEVIIKITIKIGESTIELDQDMDMSRIEIFKDIHSVLREHIEGLVNMIKKMNCGESSE